MSIAQPTEIELHLNNDSNLPKWFGPRIKEAGGRYSACRGYSETRFVHLPLTDAGRELAQKLIERFPRFRGGKGNVVIFRGGEAAPAWVVVQYTARTNPSFSQAEAGYHARVQEAVARGIIQA